MNMDGFVQIIRGQVQGLLIMLTASNQYNEMYAVWLGLGSNIKKAFVSFTKQGNIFTMLEIAVYHAIIEQKRCVDLSEQWDMEESQSYWAEFSPTKYSDPFARPAVLPMVNTLNSSISLSLSPMVNTLDPSTPQERRGEERRGGIESERRKGDAAHRRAKGKSWVPFCKGGIAVPVAAKLSARQAFPSIIRQSQTFGPFYLPVTTH